MTVTVFVHEKGHYETTLSNLEQTLSKDASIGEGVVVKYGGNIYPEELFNRHGIPDIYFVGHRSQRNLSYKINTELKDIEWVKKHYPEVIIVAFTDKDNEQQAVNKGAAQCVLFMDLYYNGLGPLVEIIKDYITSRTG